RSPGRTAAARPAGAGAVRQRRAAPTSGSSGTVRTRAPANSAGMWRFTTEESTGLKIGPVPVLVLSLVFIASVFVLHIWGKYTRT
ncbi:UNVERIFIED_CONTAM: Protein transport protein Sec61 subunit beta, partial [Eudyptes robustus]